MASNIENSLRTLRVICGALMGAVVAFTMLPLAFESQVPNEPAIPNGPVWIIAPLAVIALSFLVKRTMGQRIANLPKGAEHIAASVFSSATILAFAMREGSVLVAFVISFAAGGFDWYYAVPPIALVSMVLDWPSRERFHSWAGNLWQNHHNG